MVSLPGGQQLMNLFPIETSARRNPEAIAAQQRAFATKSPLIAGVFRCTNRSEWIPTVAFPVFRTGQPFRELSISIRVDAFMRLLNSVHLPEGWIAGIADTEGRYLTRTAGGPSVVGQPVSEGWHETLGRAGITKFQSLEGDEIVNANEVLSLGGWTVAIAVKESVLEAPVSSTLRWAISTGVIVSLLSLMFAIYVARRITRPIQDLERNAAALVSGYPASLADSLPEVGRVWDALQTAVAERQRFEQNLQVSEELLRTAAEGAQFGAHDFDAVTGRLKWSLQLKRMVGHNCAGHDVSQETAASFIHPEDREQTKAVLCDIIKGEQQSYEIEFRIVRSDGEVRWVIDRGQIIRDAGSGRVLRVIGVLIDITGRKHNELRQQTLLKELSHRVRNTLAIVQSISMQTLRSTKDPAQFADVFSERLMALARAHGLLTQRAWEGAPLDSIVKEAIAPFLSSAGESAFKMNGPAADIPANSAITLALMFHELLTNAAKYGALSEPHGRVTIEWDIIEAAGGKQLGLRWAEEGGPTPQKPSRLGFGTRLLTMSADQLDGQMEIDYAPGGLRCHLRFPLQGSGMPSLS